jgi:hypothetical protein
VSRRADWQSSGASSQRGDRGVIPFLKATVRPEELLALVAVRDTRASCRIAGLRGATLSLRAADAPAAVNALLSELPAGIASGWCAVLPSAGIALHGKPDAATSSAPAAADATHAATAPQGTAAAGTASASTSTTGASTAPATTNVHFLNLLGMCSASVTAALRMQFEEFMSELVRVIDGGSRASTSTSTSTSATPSSRSRMLAIRLCLLSYKPMDASTLQRVGLVAGVHRLLMNHDGRPRSDVTADVARAARHALLEIMMNAFFWGDASASVQQLQRQLMSIALQLLQDSAVKAMTRESLRGDGATVAGGEDSDSKSVDVTERDSKVDDDPDARAVAAEPAARDGTRVDAATTTHGTWLDDSSAFDMLTVVYRLRHVATEALADPACVAVLLSLLLSSSLRVQRLTLRLLRVILPAVSPSAASAAFLSFASTLGGTRGGRTVSSVWDYVDVDRLEAEGARAVVAFLLDRLGQLLLCSAPETDEARAASDRAASNAASLDAAGEGGGDASAAPAAPAATAVVEGGGSAGGSAGGSGKPSTRKSAPSSSSLYLSVKWRKPSSVFVEGFLKVWLCTRALFLVFAIVTVVCVAVAGVPRPHSLGESGHGPGRVGAVLRLRVPRGNAHRP